MIKAIDHYGAVNQVQKAIEEFAELTIELSRYGKDRFRIMALIEELADARIMIEQMMLIFEIDDEELDENIKFKIERLEKAMAGESIAK